MQHILHVLTIVSTKCYSAARCESCWNFEPNTVPSRRSSALSQSRGNTHKRFDVKRSPSNVTHHDTLLRWIVKCGTHNAATRKAPHSEKGREKKRRRRASSGEPNTVPRLRYGRRSGRSVVDANRCRGRECLCWHSRSPPGAMVTGHSVSSISSNNKPIWKNYFGKTIPGRRFRTSNLNLKLKFARGPGEGSCKGRCALEIYIP